MKVWIVIRDLCSIDDECNGSYQIVFDIAILGCCKTKAKAEKIMKEFCEDDPKYLRQFTHIYEGEIEE